VPLGRDGAPHEPALLYTVEWSGSLCSHARELLRHHELLLMIAQREIKVRYKQTLLGALWAIVQPFSLMLVLTVFFSLFIGIPSGDIPYPLFSYAGLLPWTFFTTALSFATSSLIAQSQIITRMSFPREIIPLACVLAALVDFAIALAVLGGMLVFYGITPTWHLLYAVPLLAIQIIFTTALALLLSAVAVVYRDVRFTVPLLLQLWMFATPILYPVASVPEGLRSAYMGLNPVAVVVDGYRRSVVQAQSPELLYLATASLISILLLAIAYWTFKRLEKVFADVV
jgi:lipopolysaccharide transport system permease protein